MGGGVGNDDEDGGGRGRERGRERGWRLGDGGVDDNDNGRGDSGRGDDSRGDRDGGRGAANFAGRDSMDLGGRDGRGGGRGGRGRGILRRLPVNLFDNDDDDDGRAADAGAGVVDASEAATRDGHAHCLL